ncbi:glycosyltransferase family 2 protein [Pseudomonas putida]|uniref:glycosyltransferase family 2 protein n=1 Tax=Pseudomonas TaxID=286 RepID=UPI000761D6E2|nr:MULTISPECIES: glycosyltransferase family 2 protein [Pseudomonas]EKT4451668.1 glycosyltransferase family 2 protein [Pseudomonas putida]EKT4562070.1 glycosyltransferase family 2 protein [Pseudomonas putida]MCE0968266.1 glycosyltransferase family 2 protein [Pseudomonas sp. NMI4491_12]MDD2068790.1 glycosyltransferase family 2 protein [Pseudomonas putida]MDP9541895.1 glycosyltransferase family 2 protein [Pseudomonas putida]
MNPAIPPLTVALLTYNRLHYLEQSIAAVLGQSYEDFELLVLDNGSTDGTAEFLLRLDDPRIRYVRNSRNISTVEFNCLSAYHLALGRRVIVTHDDDIMERDMLERQMRFMDCNPDVRLVWTRVSDIDQDGHALVDGSTVPDSERIFAPGEYISSFLKERLWPMPSGVMLERAALPKSYAVHRYLGDAPRKQTKDAAGIEDVLLPARINRRHAIGYLDQPLLRRRVHTRQFSHVASLSLPGVALYRGLKHIARGVAGLEADALHFDACTARFEIQEAITTEAGRSVSKGVLRKIAKAAAGLQANMEHAPDAFLAGLPVVLLTHLLSLDLAAGQMDKLSGSGHASATQKLLTWTRKTIETPSASILASLEGRRIIIFGSAFVAALLILEAEKIGGQVVACIDSNLNRQGKEMLGVPIQPLAWMSEQVGPDDVVIISSERDHEHYIEALIRQNLMTPASVVSWKELTEAS